jgi:hypothetical protein
MSIHQRQAGGCSGRSPRAWPRFSASCGRASTTSTDGSRPAALYGAIGLAGLAITVSGIVVGLIILSKAG